MNKILIVAALALAACQNGGASRYDEAASKAYRAAWEKRRAGDEAGYKAGLAEAAKQRGTWAGDRAALDLDLHDEGQGARSFWRRLAEAGAKIARPRPSFAPTEEKAPDPTP